MTQSFPTDALLHGAATKAPEASDDVRSIYRTLTGEEQFQVASVKEIGQELITLIDTMPMSRELALSKTKVEEAVFWAVKGITK